MTCGALQAGAEVIIAVDSDPTPLKVLGANAPRTATVVATLGKGPNDVSIPPAAPDLHVHVSRVLWRGGLLVGGRTRSLCLGAGRCLRPAPSSLSRADVLVLIPLLGSRSNSRERLPAEKCEARTSVFRHPATAPRCDSVGFMRPVVEFRSRRCYSRSVAR